MYTSRDQQKVNKFNLMRTQEDFDDETMLDDVQVKNSDLADLKKYFTMSPLD